MHGLIQDVTCGIWWHSKEERITVQLEWNTGSPIDLHSYPYPPGWKYWNISLLPPSWPPLIIGERESGKARYHQKKWKVWLSTRLLWSSNITPKEERGFVLLLSFVDGSPDSLRGLHWHCQSALFLSSGEEDPKSLFKLLHQLLLCLFCYGGKWGYSFICFVRWSDYCLRVLY